MKFNIFKNQKEMKESWNDKAETNAYHWVDSSKENWRKEEFYKKGEELVQKYISVPSDADKMKVLDIGCGTGRLTRAMSKHFGFVCGIDISDNMIEKAKKDNKDLKNIEFRLANGVDLKGFSDNYFDFVFSFIVFQHIPDKRIVNNYLKEIIRVLKRDGKMKIQVRGYPGGLSSGIPSWRYKGFNKFYIALSRKKRIPWLVFKKYDTVYGCFYKPQELKNITINLGFKGVEVFLDKGNHKYLWLTAEK